MKSNDMMLAGDTENTVAKLFQESLGLSFDDVVLSHFLEQSAKYLGVYYEQDPLAEKDDRYLIN